MEPHEHSTSHEHESHHEHHVHEPEPASVEQPASQPDEHGAHGGHHMPASAGAQHEPGVHAGHGDHGDHGDHGAHADHTGHEMMFRQRFWVSLVLTIPVLLFSPMLQDWFGFSMPEFPGDQLVGPLFAIAIFFYGGVPFLQMAAPEIRSRQPGMMTLISLAITVAFVYSVFALFVAPDSGFFWEMATLIDVMLLGHWIEMRSVRQASGALKELAKLMPDTAERISGDQTEVVPVSRLRNERSGAGAARRKHPGGWRGRGRAFGRERGDDHRRVETRGERSGRHGDRRGDQRGRQPARPRDGDRRSDRAGGDHAAGGAGAAEQIQHADPRGQGGGVAVLYRAGRRRDHGGRVADRGRTWNWRCSNAPSRCW